MKLKVFTCKQKPNDNKKCYLCGCSLKDYIEAVPDDYMKYEVQRGIVPNVYLDKLINTMRENGNIPTITLVADNIIETGKTNIEIESNFKILDGLQRTYRIKSIWECIKWFKRKEKKDIDEICKLTKLQLVKKYKREFNDIGMDIKILGSIVTEYRKNKNIDTLIRYFEENEQWFEIWKGLTDNEEIEKMLILNAGHKSMSTRHQLELLFLNSLASLYKLSGEVGQLKIIREKDMTDTAYSKNRKVGEFYFPHVISGILSFKTGEARTTNTDLIEKLQNNNDNYYREYDILNLDYYELESIMMFLIKLDKMLYETYGSVGTKWIAKETIIVGIFSALGRYSKKAYGYVDMKMLEVFLSIIDGNCKLLGINNYEEAKGKNLNVSKVNIGNKTKKTVLKAIYNLIENREEIVWESYFRGDYNE